jgi:Ran GTPase-activating protein (RanGAP) involved in mRNA processing and transport
MIGIDLSWNTFVVGDPDKIKMSTKILYTTTGKAKKIELTHEDNVAEHLIKLIKKSRKLQHLNLENFGLTPR